MPPTFGSIESERVEFASPIQWEEVQRRIMFGSIQPRSGEKIVVNSLAPNKIFGSGGQGRFQLPETNPHSAITSCSSLSSALRIATSPITLASRAKVIAATSCTQNLGQINFWWVAAEAKPCVDIDETGIPEEAKTTGQNLGRIFWIPAETITSAAEQFAKSHRVYGALLLAKDIVRKTMGSSMAALRIDRMDDPDEIDLSTVCFAITSRASVDATLERDNCLRETLYNAIPSGSLLHFS